MTDSVEVRRRVDAYQCWFHTIEVAPGVATHGRIDLRPVIDELPWPNIGGKRCLDVGTVDGFLAFELARRGAAEVVALDIQDDLRLAAAGAGARDACFHLAAELTGSDVEWRSVAVADLDAARLGTFDIVVVGSLLSYVRDPIGAARAVRSVTGGLLLSFEPIELELSVLGRGQPLFRLDDRAGRLRANAAAHKQVVKAAGFEVERISRPFVVPSAEGADEATSWRAHARNILRRAVTRTAEPGVVYRALLARPVSA